MVGSWLPRSPKSFTHTETVIYTGIGLFGNAAIGGLALWR